MRRSHRCRRCSSRRRNMRGQSLLIGSAECPLSCPFITRHASMVCIACVSTAECTVVLRDGRPDCAGCAGELEPGIDGVCAIQAWGVGDGRDNADAWVVMRFAGRERPGSARVLVADGGLLRGDRRGMSWTAHIVTLLSFASQDLRRTRGQMHPVPSGTPDRRGRRCGYPLMTRSDAT